MTTSSSPRQPWALVAAGVLVVGVVVLVLLLGIARPPELPTVADEPDPPPSSAVAMLVDDRDEQDLCLVVAEPDGRSRTLTCDPAFGDVVAWDEQGIVVRDWEWDELRWIDPASGEVEASEAVGERDVGSRLPDEVTARVRDGAVHVELDGVRLWEADVPEAYHLVEAVLSPDGSWAVLTDSADRLLVVGVDGEEPPRVWAEGIDPWLRPVWEDTPVSFDD